MDRYGERRDALRKSTKENYVHEIQGQANKDSTCQYQWLPISASLSQVSGDSYASTYRAFRKLLLGCEAKVE